MVLPLVTPLRFLAISPSEISLPAVLKCGQAFRWKEVCVQTQGQEVVEWSAGWRDRTLVLRQDALGIHYQSWFYPCQAQAYALDCQFDTTKVFLERYFCLSTRLCDLYADWRTRDPHFLEKTGKGMYNGLRVCRQDAWETLIAFICSSNNNIPRITLMLAKLCAEFGDPLPTPQSGTTLKSSTMTMTTTTCSTSSSQLPTNLDLEKSNQYFAFPMPQQLMGDDIAKRLRVLGFGYRAEYVAKTAQKLCQIAQDLSSSSSSSSSQTEFWPMILPKGCNSSSDADMHKLLTIPKMDLQSLNEDPSLFLEHLSTLPYTIAHATLLHHFAGVGQKVADCVCLFGLGFTSIVPVDVHVYRIALRDYGLRTTTTGASASRSGGPVNKMIYTKIQQFFENLWGPWAGWAQQVLFTTDLKSFSKWTDPITIQETKELVVINTIKKEHDESTVQMDGVPLFVEQEQEQKAKLVAELIFQPQTFSTSPSPTPTTPENFSNALSGPKESHNNRKSFSEKKQKPYFDNRVESGLDLFDERKKKRQKRLQS